MEPRLLVVFSFRGVRETSLACAHMLQLAMHITLSCDIVITKNKETSGTIGARYYLTRCANTRNCGGEDPGIFLWMTRTSTIPANIITCSVVFPQELICDSVSGWRRGIILQLQLQPRSRHGINFQFRLQPRSRHGKTVSNDDIRQHTVAY